MIHGKVYDVHEFKSASPCGHELLMENAGQDATTMFENAHHSIEAREMMQLMNSFVSSFSLFYFLFLCPQKQSFRGHLVFDLSVCLWKKL